MNSHCICSFLPFNIIKSLYISTTGTGIKGDKTIANNVISITSDLLKKVKNTLGMKTAPRPQPGTVQTPLAARRPISEQLSAAASRLPQFSVYSYGPETAPQTPRGRADQAAAGI